ncbi:hypothetical protein MKEN_00070400 [Mycena kentingensis (nom. inval.)]|nr:hypothetical protein MKEN_00070400 [Mycena kentingensis (nom. inval.)]
MSLLDGLLDGLLGPDDDTTTQGGGLLPTISLPISIPGLSPADPSGASASSLSAVSSVPLSSSLPLSSSALPSLSSALPSTTSEAQTTTTPLTTPPLQSLSESTQTQTNVIVVSDNSSTTSTPASTQRPQSFLENKPLSGAVFGLVGLVVLVLLFVIATFFIRRRKRSRLTDDALSFDPSLLATAERMDSEKGHSSHPSLGSNGAGAGYSAYANSPPQQHAEFYPHQPDYYGQQQHAEYYGQQQHQHADYYGQHQADYAYAPPMAAEPSWGQAQPAPAPVPTPEPQQPLARKNSIPRVPVPPAPLPKEFGDADTERRRSAEETAFWSRTLKVVNE